MPTFIQVCALLWCEVGNPDVCRISKVSSRYFYDVSMESSLRQIPYCTEQGEVMGVRSERITKKIGCWLERD